MAEDAELDLVILSLDADPPVVRIMDYNIGMSCRRRKRAAKEKCCRTNRLERTQDGAKLAIQFDPLVVISCMILLFNIDVHDYSVHLRQAQKFLKDGDKVKVIVNLKGWENEFRNNAIELLGRFQNDLGELATRENKSFEDRNVFIVLFPKKAVVQKAQEEPKKKEQSVAAEVPASV